MKKFLLMLVFVALVLSTTLTARIPEELRVRMKPEIQNDSKPMGDMVLSYVRWRGGNEISSAICNIAEYIYHFSNEDTIPEYWAGLFPYSYLGDGNNNTNPIKYIYQLTPNFMCRLSQADAAIVGSEIIRNGFIHVGDMGANNPGDAPDGDSPALSTWKWKDIGVPNTHADYNKYVWWQPTDVIAANDPTQANLSSNLYGTPADSFLVKNGYFDDNQDFYGRNYLGDRSLKQDLIQFAPAGTGYDRHGILMKSNVSAFAGDWNQATVAFVNQYGFTGDPVHVPIGLEMQKRFSCSNVGIYNSCQILSYTFVNRSLETLGHGITYKDIQLNLFIDFDIGNTYNDDRSATSGTHFIAYDINGQDQITLDFDGDGTVETKTAPTRAVGVIFLGARKAANANQRASQQTYYQFVNAISDMTMDNAVEEGTNFLGMITTNTDTTNEMKKWLQWNSMFWHNKWFSNAAAADTLNPDYNPAVGGDVWGYINAGSIPNAPKGNPWPIPRNQLCTPNRTPMILPIDLAPGEAITFTYAVIFSDQEGVTEQNVALQFDENVSGTIANKAKWIRQRYPLFQAWPVPANFWTNATIVADPTGIDLTNNSTNVNLKVYPNPLNPTTTISFEVANKEKVTVEIYNVLGQKVATLLNNEEVSGAKKLTWNGLNSNGTKVASGVYFCKVKGETFQTSTKLVVVK